MLPFLFSLTCLAAQFGASGRPDPRRRPGRSQADGIAYSLGSERDEGEPAGVFTTFEGAVVFAAGRGRLDVASVPAGPQIVANGIVIGAPLAGPGDYYLFDSTGFVLVRPSANTFSSFTIADAAYDYRYSRNGWPDWFQRPEVVVDTIANAAPGQVPQSSGRLRIFWHLDAISVLHIYAGGRIEVLDAPVGEVSVVRWFGPSQALANMAEATGTKPDALLKLTAVAPLDTPSSHDAPMNVLTAHVLWGVRSVAVDLARLTLPEGMIEAPWQRPEGSPPPLRADGGAKWRRPPGVG